MRADGIVEYKIDRQHIPYKSQPTSSSIKSDGVWRPLMFERYFGLISMETPYSEGNRWYNKTGILQQENVHNYGDPFDFVTVTFNQTFTKEGFEYFIDTITYYEKQGDKRIPTNRIYFDYHYYDRMPEDSFYHVQYSERWNGVAKEWEKSGKYYIGYFDTTLFVIREIYQANYINKEWVKCQGSRVLREYNESGVVTFNTIQEWDGQTGKYEMWGKNEYFYDEDGIHSETYIYRPNADDWELRYKQADFQYIEWYPNSHPGILIDVLDGPEAVPLSGRRAKEKSYTGWELNNNDEWEQYHIRKYEWDINGTKSHIDTVFFFFNGIQYPYRMTGHLYDERGNYTQRWTEHFSLSDIYGNVELLYVNKLCFNITYHPLYDEPEIDDEWQLIYRYNTQCWDSSFIARRKYIDWRDVSIPVSITESESSIATILSIAPNPASGIVTISATAEIEQLNIFDITGRLMSSQTPANKQVVFDTGVLPKGIYLVQARLKDCRVQTGKVVVR